MVFSTKNNEKIKIDLLDYRFSVGWGEILNFEFIEDLFTSVLFASATQSWFLSGTGFDEIAIWLFLYCRVMVILLTMNKVIPK